MSSKNQFLEPAFVQGKQNRYKIEQNNSNTRHYLSIMARRTKVVSKSIMMFDIN